jgi:hypothetical protein
MVVCSYIKLQLYNALSSLGSTYSQLFFVCFLSSRLGHVVRPYQNITDQVIKPSLSVALVAFVPISATSDNGFLSSVVLNVVTFAYKRATA